MKELILGCEKKNPVRFINTPNCTKDKFENPTTCDINPRHGSTIVHDLNKIPWPFGDNSFDEIHAYNILEHIGKQGDFYSFFDHFTEVWRILKPDGFLCGIAANWDSRWLWSDPGHTRAITDDTLVFLDQEIYQKNENTPSTDYRFYYKADFQRLSFDNYFLGDKSVHSDTFCFVLKAIKPSRYYESYTLKTNEMI